MRIVLTVALTIIWLSSSGCYFYRGVDFHVRDAETDTPIAHARVAVSYGQWVVKPRDVQGTTDDRGIVRLRVTDFDESAGAVDATADGYLPHWGFRRAEVPNWPFKEVTLHLYREPTARVVIFLPDRYRGIFDLWEPTPTMVRTPPGKREFEVNVNPYQITAVSGIPPIVPPPDPFTDARYESGEVIYRSFEPATKRHAAKDEVAIRRLPGSTFSSGRVRSYMLGTYDDWISAARMLGIKSASTPSTKDVESDDLR